MKKKILKKDELIKYYLKDRKRSKISFSNKELLFGSILKSYYNWIIEKGKQGKKLMKDIGEAISSIKDLYLEAIQKIKNNNMNQNDEIKTLILILFLPLLLNDNPFLTKLCSKFEETEEINKFLNFEESKDQLIIKKNNKELIRLNNKKIWNKFYLETDLYKTNFKNLKEIYLLEYIKLNYFQSYNFYNYEEIIKKFNRDLTKYILQSKAIKSVYAYLHPEIIFNIKNKDINYIFDKDEVVEEYLNSIIYVPFKMESYGYTSKDLLIVFIEGLPPSSFKDKEIGILSKLSSFQILSIHEGGGHWICGYNSYKYQNDDIRKSPRLTKHFFEENNINLSNYNVEKYLDLDGGDIIEILLFSRKIQFFNIREILFLLNKNSYDTDFRNFNKNFISLNDKNYDPYEEACKDPQLKAILDYLKITKEVSEDFIIPNLSLNFKRNGEIERSRCPRTFNYE